MNMEMELETGRCSTGWALAVEGLYPGCLYLCQKAGICSTLNHVLGVWMHTHDKEKVTAEVCANKNPWRCLLDSGHKCSRLIHDGEKKGLPGHSSDLDRQCS